MNQMTDDYWYHVCWEVYLDTWKLFQRHCREVPVDWAAVHEEARAIRKKHPTRMCEELLLLVIDEIERYREGG